MMINKDLMNATLMVSFIVLVLVGTTTFVNENTKTIWMIILGALCVLSTVLLVVANKQEKKQITKY